AVDLGVSNICSSEDNTSPPIFNNTVHKLLENINSEAVKNEGFATSKMSANGLSTPLYGLAIGYTAPEYATHGQLTDKADVYSYGMLVLEIVSSRKVRDPKLPLEMELLLQWAWSLHEKNEAFELEDRRNAKGESEIDKEEIVGVIHIAHLCTQSTPKMRPSMSN
ncbi:hypothetical protein KI387_041923, partial [Taxus chinensis]